MPIPCVVEYKPEIIVFDFFGTLFDLSNLNPDEVASYGNHIKQEVYQPLTLPISWGNLPLFSDVKVALKFLRNSYSIASLTNAPLQTQFQLTKNRELVFDAYIPLELAKVFKPNPLCYKYTHEFFNVDPKKILMVTANEPFGDLEGACNEGMQSILIQRTPAKNYTNAPKIENIIQLSSFLSNLPRI